MHVAPHCAYTTVTSHHLTSTVLPLQGAVVVEGEGRDGVAVMGMPPPLSTSS